MDLPASSDAISVDSTAASGTADTTAGRTALDPEVARRLKKNPDGLIAAIAQQHGTGEVLMLGWMDEEALRRTLATGRATYYSRSRQEYWRKGDTSGHIQTVLTVSLDCDGDALLLQVDQTGAACHTGTRTCFDGRMLPVSTAPVTAYPPAATTPAASTPEASMPGEAHA